MGSYLGSAAAFTIAANCDELYELGLAYATGSQGLGIDLVSAHQWFNLAALRGSEEAHHCRADIACEMTARQIGEAQRRARAWLSDLRMQ